MKAWEVSNPYDDDGCSTVVFAETRGKAKQIAMYTDACEDASYTEIQCRRFPDADKMYKDGMTELDWNDKDARIFLVKHGWRCIEVDKEQCRVCPANKWCVWED